MKFYILEDVLTDSLIHQWETVLYGEKVRNDTKDVVFNYPATWWDHFKQTYWNRKWFPKFLKKKEIKMSTYKQTVKFDEFVVYPKLSDYLNVNQDLRFFKHTQCLNSNGKYDCERDIIKY